MKKKEFLTNERLKNKFRSFFDLSNYAIHLAKEKIIKEEKVTLSDIVEDLVKLPDELKDNKLKA